MSTRPPTVPAPNSHGTCGATARGVMSAAEIALCLAVAVFGVLLAACDGGSGVAPTTAVTSSPAVPPVDVHDDPDEIGEFRLTSPAFGDGSPIPSRFTCDGDDVSPPLQWSAQPDGSQSLAIVVSDPDAAPDGFVHWVLAGIDPPSGGVAEGTDDHVAGRNDFGDRGWGGPCPPSGMHRYVFDIYAFDHAVDFAGEPTRASVEAEPGRLGVATLTGTYTRGG